MHKVYWIVSTGHTGHSVRCQTLNSQFATPTANDTHPNCVNIVCVTLPAMHLHNQIWSTGHGLSRMATHPRATATHMLDTETPSTVASQACALQWGGCDHCRPIVNHI
jgi:hypothetical protein